MLYDFEFQISQTQMYSFFSMPVGFELQTDFSQLNIAKEKNTILTFLALNSW